MRKKDTMGLEEIKSEILQEAEQKSDEIVKEAEEERDRIIEEAEEEAEQIKEEMEEELEEEKENYRKKALSSARMKAKEEKMRAKQDEIEEVFKEFRHYLDKLTESEKEKFAESCLDKVDFEVAKVEGSSEFSGAVDVDFEEKENIEGIRVISEDGSRMQSFTFDKILKQMKEEHRKEVADILF
ncbi:MAG: V/A-type H+-transporting ATPase subunit E [Candidatus Nanohaloarchaea archaeon]